MKTYILLSRKEAYKFNFSQTSSFASKARYFIIDITNNGWMSFETKGAALETLEYLNETI